MQLLKTTFKLKELVVPVLRHRKPLDRSLARSQRGKLRNVKQLEMVLKTTSRATLAGNVISVH